MEAPAPGNGGLETPPRSTLRHRAKYCTLQFAPPRSTTCHVVMRCLWRTTWSTQSPARSGAGYWPRRPLVVYEDDHVKRWKDSAFDDVSYATFQGEKCGGDLRDESPLRGWCVPAHFARTHGIPTSLSAYGLWGKLSDRTEFSVRGSSPTQRRFRISPRSTTVS